MAWAAAIAGILGAGGQIASGYLGGGTGGQGKTVRYNPALDYGLQAAQFDGLNQIGFGDIDAVPGPLQRLISQLQSSAISDRTRAEAIKALTVIGNHPELLNDPGGNNFTRDEMLGFLRDPSSIPDGRRLARNYGGVDQLGAKRVSKMLDRGESPFPIVNLPKLKKVLREQGIGIQDLNDVLAQETAFRSEIQKLRDAGLGGLQTSTILNRAEAAKSAATLLGDAGRFATGGDPSEFQSGLMNRLQKNISDQEQALLLRAQFGGFNPAAGLEGIQRMREDSDMTALTQAVQMAGALTAGLSGGSQVSQAASGQGTQASLGALGIAANQAAAANSLRQQGAVSSSESMANGLAGGTNSLSQTLLLSSLLNQKPAANKQFSFYGGPGSSANQYATQQANYGGWTPSIQF